MLIKPIKAQGDYVTAPCLIDDFRRADVATAKGDRLEEMAALAVAYEKAYFPAVSPSRRKRTASLPADAAEGKVCNLDGRDCSPQEQG